jgi:predicted nucleic acid-binding protein
MTTYVETSAVLRWLFGEPDAEDVISKVNGSNRVVSSVLTVLETQRALVRAEAQGLLKAGDAARLRGQFTDSCAQWFLLSITETVSSRAGQSFPKEPLRTLDAIHLASALDLLQLQPDLKILSFDKRILANLKQLGIQRA